MNSKTMFLIAFILGAMSGTAVTWYSVKKKYELLAQEEIDSVKEVFARREQESAKDDVDVAKVKKLNDAADKGNGCHTYHIADRNVAFHDRAGS